MTIEAMTPAEFAEHMRRSLAAPVRLPKPADARAELADTAGLIRLGLCGIHGPTVPLDIHMPKTLPAQPSAQASRSAPAVKRYGMFCPSCRRAFQYETAQAGALLGKQCDQCGELARVTKRLV